MRCETHCPPAAAVSGAGVTVVAGAYVARQVLDLPVLPLVTLTILAVCVLGAVVTWRVAVYGSVGEAFRRHRVQRAAVVQGELQRARAAITAPPRAIEQARPVEGVVVSASAVPSGSATGPPRTTARTGSSRKTYAASKQPVYPGETRRPPHRIV